MKIALTLEYDGTHFHGWQSQAGLRTIQQELENALSRVADHPIATICAGRTDKGVHARFQVVHFETEATRSMRGWVLGCNTYLPPDIAVHKAVIVPADFSARFSARRRTYLYIIDNRPTRPAINHAHVTWIAQSLDHQKMHQAAQYLIGEHDFSAFRDQDCQASHPIREIYEINITREGHFITLSITANAFLHHMVRNIVGVLLPIGRSKQAPHWAQEVLISRQRVKAGVTAPPLGLYLIDVVYESPFEQILKEAHAF